MQNSTICFEFRLHGTFKFAPKIFYQIFTLIAIYKNQALSCVFFLLENKKYETYLEALEKMVGILYDRYRILLHIVSIISDFDFGIQQAMRQAFSTNDHKLKIKGCWFHFCQAILKQVEKKLTKNQDAITCNLFQKLKNNKLLKPTHRSSNNQKEFKTQLECLI